MEGTALFLRLGSGEYAVCVQGGEVQLFDDKTLREQNALISAIFSGRAEATALVYTHPQYCLLAAAQKETSIPPVLDDMAQIVGPRVRICERPEAAQVCRALKNSNACLIRAQGESPAAALAVGKSMEHAFAAALILEKSAQAYVEGAYIGGAKPLSAPFAWLMHKIYAASYGKMDEETTLQTQADIGREIPEDELHAREGVVACGRRLTEENLVQGTWGNISVRLDHRYMLVTPSGIDYNRLTPYDIVRVDMETFEHEGRLKPTSEKGIHAAILKARSDVSCVIHSHPVNSSVFAAAKRPLPIEDPLDAALLGKEAFYAKDAIPGTKKLAVSVAGAIGASGRACIMGSHGMLVCGESIADAFEKCRTMEQAARKYLDRAAAAQHRL